MYDFDDEGIVSYASQGKQDEWRTPRHIGKKNVKKLSDEKVIEPWMDQSFCLKSMQKKSLNQKKESKNHSRNSYIKSRVSDPKPTLSSRDYEGPPDPIYRFDTQGQNIEEKLKWRMEYQFMRARRKKATQIIRIKHYGHMRSHTINPMHMVANDSEDLVEKSKNTLDVEELSRKLHLYSKKQQISNRLKTTIKFHSEKQGKQVVSLNHSDSDQVNYNQTQYGKNGMKNSNLRNIMGDKSIRMDEKNQFNVFSLSRMNEKSNINLSPTAKDKSMKPRSNWQIKKGRRNNQFKINLPKRQKSLLNGGISVNKIYKVSSP